MEHMSLQAFRVKNYTVVRNSGRGAIDTNVACLMGKNESGTSAVMQALWEFNNVSGVNYDRLFDQEHQRPGRVADCQLSGAQEIVIFPAQALFPTPPR
jgi:hypothetical protein